MCFIELVGTAKCEVKNEINSEITQKTADLLHLRIVLC